MSFLLKIVQGPNKGAEIALVDGLAVTLGKSDACDVVLADATLPDAPLTVAAEPGGVTLDGEPLPLFKVAVRGATAFAAGPADAPWSPLEWPAEEEKAAPAENPAPPPPAAPEAAKPEEPAEETPADGEEEKKSRSGAGCLVALAIFIVAVLLLAWFMRARIKDALGIGGGDAAQPAPAEETSGLEAVARHYGLSLVSENGRAILRGNLESRAARLAAMAEAFQTQPGVELDLSDDESFRAAAEDELFILTEGALKVHSATNRILAVSGRSDNPGSLKRTLEAIAADMPKLRNVDCTRVRFAPAPPKQEAAAPGAVAEQTPGTEPRKKPARKAAARPANMPVCGIITTPYPCLVLRDGKRIMEGAPLGDSIVQKIEADAVTLTNSAGRFVWKP